MILPAVLLSSTSLLPCEGVLPLRKITITVDDATLDCLSAMRELSGVSHSAAIRLAVLFYYQDKFAAPPDQKR